MRLLMVDDDQSLCESVRELFSGSQNQVETASDGFQAVEQAARFLPDCILLDWVLPDGSGLELIPRLRKACGSLVMLSAVRDSQNVIRSLKAGASNFLFKPFQNQDLLEAVKNATALSRDADASVPALAPVAEPGPYVRLPSAAMGEIYHKVGRLAQFSAQTVLIYGETGTGKEHVVHLLHDLSGPAGRPLIEVNCGAVPDAIFESEIFGHEAGAFTDARQRRAGLLEMAEGGTVFFDEIGELPLGLQSKLLKVIDERRIRRLGGAKELPLNLRIVAATNRDLVQEIKAGRFRRDLFYRLGGYNLVVPPLDQRPGDVAVLAEHFYREACRHTGEQPQELGRAFLDSLARRRWPGNVRELRNFIYSEFIDGSLGRHSGPATQLEEALAEAGPPAALVTALPTRRQTHLKTVLAVLQRHAGNKTRAAAELGITRQTLGKWIKDQETA